uniref:Protein kinase domain-containing protein n=1 Tax=Coccolithus braarudii TaxID=221442 RepID=A0A7S0LGX4_9EUKA|mmetsp:Transcript_35391/g.75599  ORF Transcript_35391/g.75599 Transcript_35391/m.75599 type:complete len:497 (+) Transcript_35391:38-1528(+)
MTTTHAKYFRAGRLGTGSYGSVVLVYTDEGDEYAAKLFDEEKEEEEDDEFDGEEEDKADPPLGVGVLREISMLKLINGSHPALMRVVDVAEIEEEGRTTLAMIMERMYGDLSAAIEKGTLGNKDKLRVAAHLLHALAFMHSYGLMHRDIKPDNVLLNAEGNPVLADFSLAKQHGVEHGTEVGAERAAVAPSKRRRNREGSKAEGERALVHTAGMGTATYMAPEVVNGDEYDLKADVWSLGVVFLELFMGKLSEAQKNKHAFAQIEELKAKMGSKPLPSLIKAMLATEPQDRISAAEALHVLPGVGGISLPVTSVPLELPPLLRPAVGPSAVGGKRKAGGRKGAGASAALTPSRAAEIIGAEQPASLAAAEYFMQRSQTAQDMGDVGAAACALLAYKLHELETTDVADAQQELEEAGFEKTLGEFEEEYAQVERQIVEELDWCLALPADRAATPDLVPKPELAAAAKRSAAAAAAPPPPTPKIVSATPRPLPLAERN